MELPTNYDFRWDKSENKWVHTYDFSLIDRYINRYSWDAIHKSKKYQVSRSALYDLHRKALEALGRKMAASMV